MASAGTSYLHSRQKSRSLWSLTTRTIASHVSWRYHTGGRSDEIISNLWSSLFPPHSWSLAASAQVVAKRLCQRGRKGAQASRVSARIMDCWAAATLIVRLQACVCVRVCVWVIFRTCKYMHVWTCVCLCNMRYIINTKLANYNCMTVSLRWTLNWTKDLFFFIFFKGTPLCPLSLPCSIQFASHNYESKAAPFAFVKYN